jgi:hypothetical protein
MRKLLLVVLAAVLSGAVAANAAESLESVRAASALALPTPAALGALKFKRALVAKASEAKQESPKGEKASRLLRASGYLMLNGSTSVAPGSGFAYVPVSGWVNLSDETGAAISGGVYMTGTAMMNVSGSFANGWVTPQAYVSLYDGGKFLGTMLVQGTIYLSGFANGSWLNVSGSGQVGGQMYVNQ